ncbi:hypothetical protein SVIOM74S_05773 [Streptomyces violarus]
MAVPSSNPRGEHTPRPGVLWTTTVGWSGEEVVDDDAEPPRPNRATRRAAKRQGRSKPQQAREKPSAPVCGPETPSATPRPQQPQTDAQSRHTVDPAHRSPE